MKKLLYSLLTLAAALTVTSCLKEVEGGSAAYDDGTLVDATFSVTLGPQTKAKAFADGTTVNQLYAGIYEIGSTEQALTYTYVAHTTDAVAIEDGTDGRGGSVTFNGKIKLGKSYKVVFWAQNDGAPYTIDWAKSATSGPNVTATATGAANDESRDAFFGMYETGAVTGSIDLTDSPIELKRPFAQVNVLVPNGNFADASAEVTSSMTVAQAPTVLNLATKATSDPADWTFSSAAIGEGAFGSYSSTHKYVAMNYVLVDQSAGAQYDVSFSVTAGSQVATDKQVKKAPLKPNGRTNIVGNVFAEDFNITVPVIIGPAPGTDEVVTTVTVKVGQTAVDAVELTYNPTTPSATSITVAVSHPVEVEADKPQITVEPATVATAEWNLTTGKLDVTPLVANGNAVITLVFPAVTKTDYSAATVQIYVKVGNGQNEPSQVEVAAPVMTPKTSEVESGATVSITCATDGAAIYYTLDSTDPTASSTLYENPIVISQDVEIRAIAIKDGVSSAITSEVYTVVAPAQKTDQTLSFAEDSQSATMGETYTLQEVSGAQTAVTYTSSEASVATIEGTTITLVGAGTTTITATAAANETYNEGTASYTLTVNPAVVLANPAVFNFANIHSAAEGNVNLSTETVAPVTLTFDKNEAGGGATVPAFNKAAGEVRMYTNNKLTISSEKFITKVEFTFVDGYGTTSAAFNEDAFNPSEATWTGSTKSLVITNPSANQIRFTEIKVTWSDEPATWPAMDPSLTFAEPSVSVEVGAKSTQVATSATGYKGAMTYSSSNSNIASVDETTGQVTGVATGSVTITATSEPNDRYTAGTASYSVTVTAATSGPKEETIEGTFAYNNNDGILSLTTDSGITITQEKVIDTIDEKPTANVNSSYNTATTLRIYRGHALTFSAPSGKTITAIAFTNTNQYKGSNAIASDVGTFTSQTNCTWVGSASTIVITNNGTDNTQFRPTAIVVTYK